MNDPDALALPPDDATMVGALTALAHPARLAILRELAAREACCCKDVVERLDLAQSTVSQHLRVLVEAGLVRYEPDNRRSRYTLDRARLAGLNDALSALVRACCRGAP